MSMKSSAPTDPSAGGRTRQSEKDACDVNLIVDRHKQGLVTTHVVQRVAEYGFAPALTFQECMDRVLAARDVFEQLPARTRDFFSNSPVRFVEFVSDPANKAKLVELELGVPDPVAPLGSADNPIHTAPLAPGGSGSGSGGNPQ